MSPARTERLSTVLDYDELLARCLNNLDFTERMLALFQDRCAADVNELEQACGRNDVETIRRISHRLAGAAANAAAFGVQARASELRRAASEGSVDQIQVRLGDLQEEWRRFSEAVALA